MKKAYITLEEATGSLCPMMSGTVGYLNDFLAKPHESLAQTGHKGTVCPFTPRVLKGQTVTFTRLAIDPRNEQSTTMVKEKLTNEYLPDFLSEIELSIPVENRELACLLVVISGLNTADECNTFVSLIQKEVQPIFVKAGLLLSELHPYSPVPSVRNPDFFPSRPPFPIFFIRRIIPNDIPYLLRTDRYDEETYETIFDTLVEKHGIETIRYQMERLNRVLTIPRKYLNCRLQGGTCNCEEVRTPNGFGLLSWCDIECQCAVYGKKSYTVLLTLSGMSLLKSD